MGTWFSCFPSRKREDPHPSDEEPDIDWFDSIPGTDIPSFDCEICSENMPLHGSFNINGCSHVFCINCVVTYIVSKLDENIPHIRCPIPGCNGHLDPEYCRFMLPRRVFNRWGIALTESAVPESQKFYCPYNNCSRLIINDRKPKENCPVDSTCHYCKRVFCVQCKEPWHKPMNCIKFQELKKKGPEAFFQDWARRNEWKKCPNCRMYIQKRSGCPIIRCRCGSRFCYDCGHLVASLLSRCRCFE